jgi:hypothetical protein
MALILRKIKRRSRRDKARTRTATRFIRISANRASIPVHPVRDKELQHIFHPHDAVTKAQIAEFLARFFPELASRVPEARKAWDSESWNMAIFDAAALAVAYLAKNDNAVAQEFARFS